MTPLMVKGTLFGLLLLSAAVWDMRNREIPNLIPALLLLCGLIPISFTSPPRRRSAACFATVPPLLRRGCFWSAALSCWRRS